MVFTEISFEILLIHLSFKYKNMISFFRLAHRFKRGMLEIISDAPDDILDKYLDPTQTEKLPESVKFKVAAGKKEYDIIQHYQSWQIFYSQRIIDVLSLFTDMSDKCYPVNIDGVDKRYYVIYNLETYPFWNKDETVSMRDDPYIFGIQDNSIPIFGIDDTGFVIVSESVKDALLKNKISNINLNETFGCSFEEYEIIKDGNFTPDIHIYEDK